MSSSVVAVDEPLLGEVDEEVQRQLMMSVSKVEAIAYLCPKCAHETYKNAFGCDDCARINDSSTETIKAITMNENNVTSMVGSINENVLEEWSRKERIRAEQDLKAWMRARALIAERERQKIIGVAVPKLETIKEEVELEEGEVDDVEEWKRWFGDAYEDVRAFVMSDEKPSTSQKPNSYHHEQEKSLVVKRKRGRPPAKISSVPVKKRR